MKSFVCATIIGICLLGAWGQADGSSRNLNTEFRIDTLQSSGTGSSAVSVSASAWMGMALLGSMAIAVRRRRIRNG